MAAIAPTPTQVQFSGGCIEQAEISAFRPLMVFVGPNDSGKTSALRGIADALSPTKPEVRKGRWSPDTETSSRLRRDYQLPDEDTVWIEESSSRHDRSIVVPRTDEDGTEFREYLAVELSPPIDEVVWVDVPEVASLGVLIVAALDHSTTDELCTLAFDLLPPFARTYYDRVTLDENNHASTWTPGLHMSTIDATIELDDLAAGIRSWLLLALAEACRKVRRPATHRVLYLFDEPEIHLHPVAQREAATWLLHKFTGPTKTLAIATHSPHFVDAALRRRDTTISVCSRAIGSYATIKSWPTINIANLSSTATDAGLLISDVFLTAAALVLAEGKDEVELISAVWQVLYGELPLASGVHLVAGAGIDNILQIAEHLKPIWVTGSEPAKPFYVLIDNPDLDRERDKSAFAVQATTIGVTLRRIHRFDILACDREEVWQRAGLWRKGTSWDWNKIEEHRRRGRPYETGRKQPGKHLVLTGRRPVSTVARVLLELPRDDAMAAIDDSLLEILAELHASIRRIPLSG